MIFSATLEFYQRGNYYYTDVAIFYTGEVLAMPQRLDVAKRINGVEYAEWLWKRVRGDVVHKALYVSGKMENWLRIECRGDECTVKKLSSPLGCLKNGEDGLYYVGGVGEVKVFNRQVFIPPPYRCGET